MSAGMGNEGRAMEVPFSLGNQPTHSHPPAGADDYELKVFIAQRTILKPFI